MEELLGKHDQRMRKLFLRVMNLHAGYQVSARSEAEVIAEIRKAIEEACDEE